VVYNNLGTVLKDQGALDKALAAFDNAIALKADYAEGVLQSRYGPATADKTGRSVGGLCSCDRASEGLR